MMDSHAIHSVLGAEGWRNVLLASGLTERQLSKRAGPCPACGGSDRYLFDNRYGRGDFFCRQCGPGDGFQLLMRAQGLSFKDARALVLRLAGLDEDKEREEIFTRLAPAPEQPKVAQVTRRVLQLIRESCAIEDCEPVREYLASRSLWPLPSGHTLRAHSSVEYWHDKRPIGRFPALLGIVRDANGETVTVHVTYLEPSGEKLRDFDPRKILSGMSGREGCAVRLMSHRATLGIAEGIETALSASVLHEMPVWAALNTSLLQKFTPPAGVERLVIFADRDVAGLESASKLMERLQGRIVMEVRTPKSKDWNDSLRSAA
jgi:putative DNA primase/helicase